MSDHTSESRTKEIRFSVVWHAHAFKKGLGNAEEVKDVRQLPMLNKVIVEFDPAKAAFCGSQIG